MTDRPRVGFVGLGSQGGPMARRIVEAGFPTTLWARRPETTAPYDDTAVTIASSRVQLGEASDVLAVCVVADADVDEVLRGPDGALGAMAPGSTVVIHSTVHPDTCRRLQDDHPDLVIVDAPVSGGGHLAATRELLVMVGGEQDAVDRCRPVFETFADPVVHLGPLGSGQRAKVLNNALFTAHLGLAADLFAQGEVLGLDPTALAEVIGRASGRSYGAEVLRGSGDLSVMAEFAGPLLAKDVGIVAELLPASSPLLAGAQAALAAMGRSA